MLTSIKALWTNYWANYSGFSRDIWIQFAAILINSIGWMVSLYLSLYLQLELGYSVSSIGWIILFFGFGFLVGNYSGGFFCDIIQPRTVMIITLVFLGISTIALGLVVNILLLVTVIFFVGFFNGAFRPASNLSILASSKTYNKTRLIGFRRVAVNLGISCAGLIGGIVVSFGYSMIFYFDGLSSIIAAIVLFCYCQKQPEINFEHDKSAKSALKLSIFKNNYFLKICLFGLLASLVFVQVKTVYPIYLHDHYHILVQKIAYLTAINGLMIILIEIPLLNFLRQYSQELVAAFGGFFICLGFAILPLSLNFSFAVLGCLIYTLGEIMLYPTLMVLALECSHGHNKGKFMGTYQFIFSIPDLCGPVFGATIYQYASPTLLWLFCGVIGVIVFIGFYSLQQQPSWDIRAKFWKLVNRPIA